MTADVPFSAVLTGGERPRCACAETVAEDAFRVGPVTAGAPAGPLCGASGRQGNDPRSPHGRDDATTTLSRHRYAQREATLFRSPQQMLAWKPGTDVVAQALGEGLVLVHLRTNHMYELNSTGARLWELMAEGRSAQEVEDTLAREFDVDAAALHVEVTAMLRRLEEEELIVHA